MRYTHNRNTTFYWSGDIIHQSSGQLADLSDQAIKSQIRNRNGDLIATLNVQKDTPQSGFITIRADSSKWPIGDALWDITITRGDITVATETVNLKIIDGGTHAS